MITKHGAISNFFLKVSDLSLVLVALGLTIVYRYSPSNDPGFALDYLSQRIKVSNAVLGALLVIIWHLAFAVQGLYLSHRLRSHRQELNEVARAVLFSAMALLAAAQVGHWPTINASTVATFGILSGVLVGGTRMLLRLYLQHLREKGHNVKTLLLIGGGVRSQQFATQLRQRKDLGYRVLGYIESNPAFVGEVAGLPWVGSIEQLPEIISNTSVDEVAIALPVKSQYTQIQTAIEVLEEQGITTHLLSDLFPHRLARYQHAEFEGLPIISLHSAPIFSWRTEAKRLFDLIAASLALLVLWPLFVLVAIAIKLDSPGPVFFIQSRFGFSKRRFRMIKFRTMEEGAEARQEDLEHLNEKTGPIFKVTKDPRITRIGRWLRKLSIDELPQLVNVLLGDMSIVGPRPLSVRDASRMEVAWQKRRFSVKPGLTCLWQVSGRSNLSFEQWMELDLQYIDHWSLKLDASIVLRTIPAILLARGAS